MTNLFGDHVFDEFKIPKRGWLYLKDLKDQYTSNLVKKSKCKCPLDSSWWVEEHEFGCEGGKVIGKKGIHQQTTTKYMWYY